MKNPNQNSSINQGVLIDNRYEVLELLKSGGNEVLLRALDKSLENEKVLLKVFYVSKETSASNLKRFRNEVIISRKLAHPNICRIYDLGRFEKNYYYISLEDRGGHSLEEVLDETLGKGLPFKFVVDIVYQVANALIEAHSQGVIHRKLSTENIMFLIENGRLKNVFITGFGFGRLIDQDSGLTRTGELVGTPAYMAPEQITGSDVDARIDIYALGILGYEMLTCTKPWGEDVSSVLRSLNPNAKLPNVTDTRKDVPAWFGELINKACAKHKEDRYATAKELRDDILLNLEISKSLKRVKKNKSKNLFKSKLFSSKSQIACVLFLSVFFITSFLFYPQILHYSFGTPLPTEKTDLNAQTMFASVLSGDEPGVFKALKAGISAHIKDKTGTPLISLASNLGKVNIVYTLIEHDPSVVNDVDNKGRTPLIIAVQKNKRDVIDLLMASNSDPNLADKTGKSAADYARKSKINLHKK